MNGITKLTKSFSEKLTVWDRTLLKIYLVVAGLLLAKLFPVLISLHRGWYVAVIVVLGVYFLNMMRGGKK